MTLQTRETPGDTRWFVRDRFGLFIHWGLYALPARHEWVRHYEKTSREDYEKYFKHFDPDLYDPAAWAREAANAGMKYFVVTTKHHEGFCLWDSQLTDYKATKTPAGRDLLKPMVEAFRAEGLRVGLYHSLLDWHHPHYTTDRMHPMRDNKEYRARDGERDTKKYRKYLHGQTREILTNFGKIDIIWFDYSFPPAEGCAGKGREDWDSANLIKLVRQLQPGILINDRLQIDQDIKTPEQVQPSEWLRVKGSPVVWEACQTFSGSWGYHRDEASWKSVDMLIKMLIDTVSKGGNLLLNVGPTARGEFDERALSRLRGIGEWMKRHGRSIYGCTQAPDEFPKPQDGRYTWNPETGRLYLHVFSWPFGRIHLDGLGGRVEYAQLLNDASEIKMIHGYREKTLSECDGGTDKSVLTLEIPAVKPNVAVPVIELFLKKAT